METELKTFLIPDELCRRAGVAATWLPINEIGIFPSQQLKVTLKTKDEPSSFASSEVKVYNLRQETILFQPILRKLINEANGTFICVQNLANSVDFKESLLKVSREYRSIVRACLENLQEEIVKTKCVHRDELQNYITIYYSVECIWHLCEILFIDVIPGDVVLPHLMEWVRFHFPKYERKAASMLANDLVGLELHDDYWQTIIGSLLKGRIEVVRAMLRLHSASDSNPFRIVDETLKTMPVYNIFSGLSATEFNLKRKQWVVDAESKIDAKFFVTEEKLHLIMQIITGNESAWSEVQVYCETWYELLAGWLFYTDPTVKSYELGRLAKKCIAKMGIRNHMKHLDTVLLAAMESNVLQVIKEIQCMAENGWFVTHLTDLLYHSGCMDVLEKKPSEFDIGKLRESFVLDYGTLLMGHNSLWQVGLSYLDHCPTNGKNAIELLLSRLPLGSEARTHKIIREARKRDLHHVVQSICKVQGIRFMKKGRLGNALTWALKSQNGNFASYLAEKFLKEYCNSGKLQSTDLLDNLGSCMLLSDRLVFLGKYCEFHKVYNNRQYREAANLLSSLISSKITPEYFWLTLLTDALPLLECDDLVFSSNDTYMLMHYLEEKRHIPQLKDKIDLIRLATARNLARALTYEAQISI